MCSIHKNINECLFPANQGEFERVGKWVLYRFIERVFIFCLWWSRRLAVQVTEIEGSRHRGSAVAKINWLSSCSLSSYGREKPGATVNTQSMCRCLRGSRHTRGKTACVMVKYILYKLWKRLNLNREVWDRISYFVSDKINMTLYLCPFVVVTGHGVDITDKSLQAKRQINNLA